MSGLWSFKRLPLQCCLILFSSRALTVSGSNNFRWYCHLNNEPIVELRWDAEENTYVVWDGLPSDDDIAPFDTNGDERRLNGNDFENDFEDQDGEFSLSNLRGGTLDIISNQRAAVSAVSSRYLQANRTNEMRNANKHPSQDLSQQHPKMLVRRCPCWNPNGLQDRDFYCPISNTHCGLGAGWTSTSDSPSSFVYEDPGCLNVERQRSFARNVWPIVTVWYLAMFLCLFLTRPGRHILGLCISKVWPQWNVYATDRIINQNPEYANRVVFRRMASRSAASNANRLSYAGFEVTFELSPMPPQNSSGEEFLLRTKTFRTEKETTDAESEEDTADDSAEDSRNNAKALSTTESDEESTKENDGASTVNAASETESVADGEGCNHADGDASQACVACTICHLDLEDGDRVGDLPCGHTFHIDCLKSWIARRNVCPLCLAENIATPRRDPSEASRGQSTMIPLPEVVVEGEQEE